MAQMSQEEIHNLIHCNLQQLHLLYPISFTIKEGMFKVPNIRGFQEIMHYLFSVINPEKCKKMIPWPILDKKVESQFRIAVKAFLLEINENYPEAGLPKIVPSILMNPGGEKFARLMWKLTKFALCRSLGQIYGTTDMLMSPRTFKNDPLAVAKCMIVRAAIESTTQKAFANQLKIDSVVSQELERKCNIELNELEQEVRNYESTLQELVKNLPVSADMKEKLCNLHNNDVIPDWIAEVEAESRSLEAIIHVVNKVGSSVTSCHETVRVAEVNDTAQLCIDANCLIAPGECRKNVITDEMQELIQKMQEGKLSMSSLIQSLVGSQALLLHQIGNRGLQNMTTILPELQTVNAGFHDCEVSLSNIDSEMREKLNEIQKNCEEFRKDLKSSKCIPALEEKLSSSVLSTLPSTNVDFTDEHFPALTPVRGVYENIFKEHAKPSSSVKFDPQLLLTPEFDRVLESPLYVNNVPSVKIEHATPMYRSIFTVPSSVTTNRKPPRATDLHALTSSLVKKKKCAELAHQVQYQSIPRQNKPGCRFGMTTVSKELFEESPRVLSEKGCSMTGSKLAFGKSTQNVLKKDFELLPTSPYEPQSPTDLLLDDSMKDMKEEIDDLSTFSFVEENDVMTSPPLLLCTVTPTETDGLGKGKTHRRKSLDALIQRYLKVRQKMEI